MPKAAKKKVAPYTPKQFAAAVREFAKGDDREAAYILAEALLCEQLELLGYKEAINVFNKMEKWYA